MPIPLIGVVLVLVLLVLSAPFKTPFKDDVAPAPPAASARSETDNRYERQGAEIAQAYAQYKQKVAQVWGEEAVVPDAKRNVTYRDNLRQRSVVDFEEGVVTVELAVAPDKAQDSDTLQSQLATAVGQTVLQGPDDRSIVEMAEHPDAPQHRGPSALVGLIANEDGSPFTLEDLEDFQTVAAKAMLTHPLTGADGEARVVVTTEFKLVPDHLRVQAEKFRDSIERYAQQHAMPAPLIYAIIETESAFNPLARSPIPAFGLMQLVPQTGAREAFKFLYSKDQVVSERHLYIPDKNIELGTAYLHLLYHRYFKKVKDPESRKWLAVAAYNAGPINVVSTFAGRYSRAKFASTYIWKRQAFKKINKMPPAKLFTYLRRHLPARETRNYLYKVHSRVDKYRV